MTVIKMVDMKQYVYICLNQSVGEYTVVWVTGKCQSASGALSCKQNVRKHFAVRHTIPGTHCFHVNRIRISWYIFFCIIKSHLKNRNNTHNTFTRKLFKTYIIHIESNILFDFKRPTDLFGNTDIYEYFGDIPWHCTTMGRFRRKQ